MAPNKNDTMLDNTEQMRIERLKKETAAYLDFPKPGVIFRDIFSLTKRPPLFSDLMDILLRRIQRLCPEAEAIVGLDARGFLLGPTLSLALKIPFVPIRKRGKLPGNIESFSYALEYGEDVLEIQKDSIKPQSKVVIVDDLLATGGTMQAAAELVVKIGSEVSLCIVCIELEALQGRKKILQKLDSLIQY